MIRMKGRMHRQLLLLPVLVFLIVGVQVEAVTVPNVSLEFTVQQLAEDKLYPWYHTWYLYCAVGRCRLSVMTIGQCVPPSLGDPAKFYPKLETFSTEEGNLEVNSLSNNVLDVKVTLSEAIILARIGYSGPITLGEYMWFSKAVSFSGGGAKQSSILDKVITWHLVPLKGQYHTVKLDCHHILVVGLEEDRQRSSSPLQSSDVARQAAIRTAQIHLREEGFYSGPVDGKIGPQTQRAIRQYQAKHGLTVTGELDDLTQKAMGLR